MKSTQRAIEKYLRKAGVRHFRSREQFWEHIGRTYGHDVADGLGESREPYDLIYRSLDLSLDVLSLNGDLHSVFLEWILECGIDSPMRLLDLGCGNGIIGCFFAWQFPEALVLGIDRQAAAIDRANELRARLGISNIEFRTVAIEDAATLSADGPFDLVVSVVGMHGALEAYAKIDDERPFSQWTARTDVGQRMEFLTDIGRLLTPSTGVAVFADRLPSPWRVYWFLDQLERGGFDAAPEEKLDVRSFGQRTIDQRLPVVVATYPATDTLDPEQRVSQVLEFNSQDDLGPLAEGFKEELAEAIFGAIGTKRFRSGYKVEYDDGSGVLFVELWETGPFCLRLDFTTRGYRALRIFPLHREREVLEELETQLGEYPAQIEQYEATRTPDFSIAG